MASNTELAVILKLVADQFQAELKKSNGILGDFGKAVADWRVQLAAVGTAILAVTKSTASYGEELLKTSQQLGITVEQLAALRYAAELGDVEMGTFTQSLGLFSKNAASAAVGGNEASKAFAAVGVNVKGVNGEIRPTEDLLLQVAEAFANAEDDAGKTAVAMALFGRAGKEMIPFLNQGKAGIKELMEEAKRLGLVISTEDAKAADEFNDNLTRLQRTATGLKLELGNQMIPTFNSLADSILKAAKAVKEFRDEGGLLAKLHNFLVENIPGYGSFAPGAGRMINDIMLGPMKPWAGQIQGPMQPVDAHVKEFQKRRGGGGGKNRIGLPQDETRQFYDEQIEEFRKYQAEQYKLYITGLTSAGEDLRALQARTGDDMVEEFKERQKDVLEARKIEAEYIRSAAEESQRLRLEEMNALEALHTGLHKYLTDLESTFNIATDMARQTAGQMSQGFKTLFLDSMRGQMTSLKDVMRGVLNFAENIIADVASRLATRGLLSMFDTGMANLFQIPVATAHQYAAPIGPVPAMAAGGIVTRPTFAMVGEAGPEAVVPLDRYNGGGVSVVVNNYAPNTQASAQPGPRVDGKQTVYVMVTEAVNEGLGRGEFDGKLQQVFGLDRKGTRR